MPQAVTTIQRTSGGQFVPGQSGNPLGRPNGVVYPGDLIPGLRALNDDGSAKFTRANLEEIVADPKTGPALGIAVQWLVDCMNDGERWVIGKDGELKPAGLDPVPSRVREALSDRLEGKPLVRIQSERKPMREPQEIENDMVKMIEANPTSLASLELRPGLLEKLRRGGPFLERMRPLLKVHAPDLLKQVDELAPVAATL